MEQDDDFAFVRNHLTRELAEELGLFRYQARSDGQITVLEPDLSALHEAVLAPKYNFGAPIVSAALVRNDGTLWNLPITVAPMGAAWTSSAAPKSPTCRRCGAGRLCLRP